MVSILLNVFIAALLIGLYFNFARKKRLNQTLHYLILIFGVFWMPCAAIIMLHSGTIGIGWLWLTVSIFWEANLLVLGLCLMYGSKTIHLAGRQLMIGVITAITLLLLFLLI